MSRLALGVGVVVLTGCGEPTDTSPAYVDTNPVETGDDCDPTYSSVEHADFSTATDAVTNVISPSSVDPSTVLQPDDDHYVVVPLDVSRDELLVFLPGAANSPVHYQTMLALAARSGYRTIGLAYASSLVTAELCSGQGDDCYEGVDAELAYGEDTSALVEVGEADGIAHRLGALLTQLATDDPTGGWDGYLAEGAVSWDKVVLAGFAQGATLAGYLSRDNAVSSAVFFSGGCDLKADENGGVEPVAWCYDTRVTPPDNMYGIVHEEASFSETLRLWEAFGMPAFGDVADADTQEPRYCTGTHMLSTGLPDQAGGDQYERSLAEDQHIPVNATGWPLDADDDWYLLTHGGR